ncbi:lathosterol oxidase [Lingula anatina]|uniref:Lathosterol oxidase n=1 Tax=Lingula anatina TaxID=7574 RepID=A0A1S3I7C5_LINAN|nr:lathosterol oxidase [Lingula anatina]|eukprot:XP_013394103.1 lathosterol oxidase [Lingula anatina]
MDLVLDVADRFVLDSVYPTGWARDDPLRQIISLLLVVNIGGLLIYIIPASLSYYFIYDHRLLKHPQILENQVWKEIKYALGSIPYMSLPTCSIFFLELQGYSRLYDNVEDMKLGWFYLLGSVVTFILFTDMCIYWIHRFLHHRLVYKYIHKDHHRWKVPTPYASHAFHPADGFLQSCPYHIYPFLFPLHKILYLILFVFVNIWTVSIHDGDFRVPEKMKPFVNGSAHHMDHHVLYNYNYGQFFTLWDRLGGSFRVPSAWSNEGPLYDILRLEKKGASNGKMDSNGTKKES